MPAEWKMATTLAMVSLQEWMLTGFDGLEEEFKRDFYGAFEESSFKSVAKFILHTTDGISPSK